MFDLKVSPIGLVSELMSTASPHEWLLGDCVPRIGRQANPQVCPALTSYPCRFSVAASSVATSGAMVRCTYTVTPARPTATMLDRWLFGQPLPQPRACALPTAPRVGRGG